MKLRWMVSLLVLPGLAFSSPLKAEEASPRSRPPQFAGSFYPSEENELREMLRSLLAQASSEGKGEASGQPLWGIVVPHAGYVYSGKVAAQAYTLLEEDRPNAVILLGPSHRIPFQGASIWAEGTWKTPLGEVTVDTELADAIRSESKLFDLPDFPHLPEHSLETQIPFLQMVLPGTPIVPVLVSDPSQVNCTRLARAIDQAVTRLKRKVLYVVSTDFSHYKDLETARGMDAIALEAIEKADSMALARGLGASQCEMCGQAATLTFLELLKYQPEVEVTRLAYDTSASASGDASRVVGYGAFAFRVEASRKDRLHLDKKRKKELLVIARKSLRTYLETGKRIQVSSDDAELKKKRGVFVTLLSGEFLRGCVGFPDAVKPLDEAVADRVVAAALHDRRFSDIALSELDEITIKISVLSKPVLVSGPETMIVGEQGALIEHPKGGGLLLPGAAEGTSWDRDDFLNLLCIQKAGLGKRCWEDPETRLYLFDTLDFDESLLSPGGSGS